MTENKERRVTFRLTIDEFNFLKKSADAEHLTVTAFIRRAALADAERRASTKDK